jgi:uncharacterized protein (TIGR03067 family)
MRCHVLTALGVALLSSVGLLTASRDHKEDANNKELKKLQGIWIPISVEIDGSVASPDELRKMRVTITDNEWILHIEGKLVAKGTFKVDPAKEPATIDMIDPQARARKQAKLGIYKLDGDMLVTCFAALGKERPSKFSGNARNGQELVVYKRQKPK